MTRSLALPLLLLVLASLAATGCRRDGVRLVIVAESDLTAYEEVDGIEAELVGVGLSERTSVGRRDDLSAGLTVFDRTLDTLAGRHVRLTFTRDGETVLTRDLVFDHLTDREIHVLLPRECGDVACAEDETCVRGTCALPTCVDGTEADCPEPTCTSDDACVAEASCARAECRDGACLALGDDDACDDDLWCDPRSGCAPSRTDELDAGPGDAGPSDAGVDVGDAGHAGDVEAGDVDAGDVDAGEVDAGEVDAGEVDAGEVDAGEVDAGEVDAGMGG